MHATLCAASTVSRFVFFIMVLHNVKSALLIFFQQNATSASTFARYNDECRGAETMMNALGANMHPYFVKPPADAARFVAVVPGSDGCETHANMMRMLHKTVDEIILILPHFCGQHATSLV